MDKMVSFFSCLNTILYLISLVHETIWLEIILKDSADVIILFIADPGTSKASPDYDRLVKLDCSLKVQWLEPLLPLFKAHDDIFLSRLIKELSSYHFRKILVFFGKSKPASFCLCTNVRFLRIFDIVKYPL